MPLSTPDVQSRGFVSLRIIELRQETTDAISLALEVSPELAEQFRFKPGQYLTLRGLVEGEEVRRSYSICSGPGEPLRIAIKRVENGRFSSWAHGALAEGHSLQVMPPLGRFTLPEAGQTGTSRMILAVAAGSGITPLLAIIKAVLATEPASRVTLLYGSRSTATIMFREELQTLNDRFMARLTIMHVLSREQQDIPALNGRLDRAKVATLLAGRLPDLVLLCGPGAMIDSVQAGMLTAGMSADSILSERFASEDQPTRAQGAPVATAPAPPYATASVIADGVATEVPIRQGESVLAAALRAGLSLPYSCRAGMCNTCRARVTQGSVRMDVNYGLEPWETEAGFVLTCQAHATTPHITVDYDQL